MIQTEIKENIKNIDENVLNELVIEKVFVSNEDLAKRIHHFTRKNGEEIAVRLAKGKHLHVGDVLFREGDELVVVDVLPEKVLVIAPKDLEEMGTIAHELGNRHLPAQFMEDKMLVQFDYLVENLLKEKGLAYCVEDKYLQHPFRHIGHSHDE